MTTKKRNAFWLLCFWGCGGSDGEEHKQLAEPGHGVGHAEVFTESPPPVEDGSTRYYSSVQEVAPGQSLMLVEWVAPASDRDMDVMNVSGGQTVGGHHATLTSSPAVEALNSVRPQLVEDQLTATFLGAVGGEGQGAGALAMPENYAFRWRKGEGLYIQTHYVNVTASPIRVQSYIDAKVREPSKDHVVLSLFSHGTVKNRVAPSSQTNLTIECVTQRDLPLVMFTNHLHEYGTKIRTEALLPDGSVSLIKEDPVWKIEWTNAANYKHTFDAPVVVPKGATLRTHCTWLNTTTRELTFPEEMCAFVAFLPIESSINCVDGAWSENAGGASAMH